MPKSFCLAPFAKEVLNPKFILFLEPVAGRKSLSAFPGFHEKPSKATTNTS